VLESGRVTDLRNPAARAAIRRRALAKALEYNELIVVRLRARLEEPQAARNGHDPEIERAEGDTPSSSDPASSPASRWLPNPGPPGAEPIEPAVSQWLPREMATAVPLRIRQRRVRRAPAAHMQEILRRAQRSASAQLAIALVLLAALGGALLVTIGSSSAAPAAARATVFSGRHRAHHRRHHHRIGSAAIAPSRATSVAPSSATPPA
jgi:hypothetical protein